MKKLTFILVASLALVTTAMAQKDFNPYINAGVNLSQQKVGVAGEVGIYNAKTWYAVGLSVYDDVAYGSVKAYYNILKSGPIDTYVSAATNINLEDASLSFEPGIATVFNVSDRVAPQLGLSVVIPETFEKSSLSASLGINVWLFR